MQTAANATTGSTTPQGDRQRVASTPKPSGSGGVPHVLARLPDLRQAKQQLNEPQAVSYSPAVSKPAAMGRPPLAAPPMARAPEVFAVGPSSEFFEPQVLPSLERVWQSSRDWLSKHAKVAMVVVAMIASHSMLMMWRQAPVEHGQSLQPLGDAFELSAEDTAQLHPVPMENESPSADRQEGPKFADRSALDEPHLALPRPEPDPISLSAPPHLSAREDPAAQPKLAVASKRWSDDAQPSEQDLPSESSSGAAAEPSAAGAASKDVPPWESWSDEKASTPLIAPATEAAAQAAPRLAPPDGSGGIEKAPDEARTASLSADRPSSRAGSVQRPRSVAKLKGTINKTLAEPANEHVRRSLY